MSLDGKMTKYTALILLAVITLTLLAQSVKADPIKAWKIASPSVVSVLPTWPGFDKPGFGAPPGSAPEGTGIVISTDGHVLTAAHVVTKATEIKVRDIAGHIFKAKQIFSSPETDLAILQTDIKVSPIKLATSIPEIGSQTCLISNAFGLDLSIACGVVSAMGRQDIGFNQIEDFIQTDTAANPGSSGGALVNMDGALIGMMSGIFTKNTDTNVGVNFAISKELIRKSTINSLD